MSWASEKASFGLYRSVKGKISNKTQLTIRELLDKKAQENNLILCLPDKSSLSNDLEKLGAHVYTFNSLGVVPESRFTIIRYGRFDAEVAIGHRFQGRHRIETFQRGLHPAQAMADDLVDFVKHFNEYALNQRTP